MARSGRSWLLGSAAALAIVAAVAGFVALRRGEPAVTTASNAASAASAALLAPDASEKRWKDLTPAQQRALEPLKAGWEDLGPVRKQKWLEIAGRFASMKPAEQQRVHARMREWVELTPEERKAVRENFARAQKMVGRKKAAQWEEYQLLPEEQKRKLADAASTKKPQAAKPPTPAQSLVKTPQPIKPHGQGLTPSATTPALATGTPSPGAAATGANAGAAAPAPSVPQEMVYPLEGAATPAAMMQTAPPPAPPPAPAPASASAPAAAPAPQATTANAGK